MRTFGAHTQEEVGGMKGHILDYSVTSNQGTVTGTDGNRYYFAGPEWKGTGIPTRGMAVDFEAEGNQAKGVYVALGAAAGSSVGGTFTSSSGKNKVAAGLLAIFLGGLGIHKFYLGFTGPGLVFLL